MAALISMEIDPEQQSIYISDAKRNGIDVLPPDLNISNKDFTISEDDKILFGYNQVKGLGKRVIDKITSIKPFNGFGDFLIKAYHTKGVNKKVIETLIQAGACDAFGYKRSCMVAGFEKFITDYTSAISKDPEDERLVRATTKEFINEESQYFDLDMPEFSITSILQKEKELLGVYISGNPFDIFASLVDENVHTIKELNEVDRGSFYVLGQINKIKRIQTKNGKSMAFTDLSDVAGDNTSFIMFPNIYEQYGELLEEDKFVLFFVTVKEDSRGKSFLISSVRDLTDKINNVESQIEAENNIRSIDIHLEGNPGTVRLKSIIRKLEEFLSDEDTGYRANIVQDIGDVQFLLNQFNLKKIDISVLRAFSKFEYVYINRSI